MNQLDSFTIHQFRGIRDLKLEGLGTINVIVGINNSGKTSVLEALSIYCDSLNINSWIDIARQREHNSKISPLDSMRWLFNFNKENEGEILLSSSGYFKVKALKATYEEDEEIYLVSERIRSFLNKKNNILEEDSTETRKVVKLKVSLYDKEINFDHASIDELNPSLVLMFLLKEDESFSSSSNKSGNFKIPLTIVTPSSHRSELTQVRLLTDVILKNFQSDVVRLIQQLDENICDIQILDISRGVNSRPSIFFEHRKLGIVPVSIFGDGVRRLLHIALKLANTKGGILLIDEIESSLHTEALQNAFNWLSKWCTEMDVQLFTTTHSLEVIDCLIEATESYWDLVFYRLEPKDNYTHVFRHDRSRLKRLREELGQEVRW